MERLIKEINKQSKYKNSEILLVLDGDKEENVLFNTLVLLLDNIKSSDPKSGKIVLKNNSTLNLVGISSEDDLWKLRGITANVAIYSENSKTVEEVKNRLRSKDRKGIFWRKIPNTIIEH